jgi:methyl-accepting chemotaxis protein
VKKVEYKRRNYVIDRRLQFGMISLFLTAVLIALFVTSTGFVVYFWARYASAEAGSREYFIVYTAGSERSGARGIDGADGRAANEGGANENGIDGSAEETGAAAVRTTRMEVVLPPLLINNLCIMILIAILGVFFSHRIAGPLYRIQLVITAALEGDHEQRVHLRPRDFGGELADKVNELLDNLKEAKRG